LRSESGYLTYIITTRRITSGELLKYRKGLLMARSYHGLSARGIWSDIALGRTAVVHDAAPQGTLSALDRDRGTPRDATPPTPPGIRVPYHGGSTELGLGGRIDLGKSERLEIVVAYGLLDRRVSGHAPEPGW
jgi:hypothetical protein